MPQDTKAEVEQFINGLKRRNPGEQEFHQAVAEVAETVLPFVHDQPKYRELRILERMTEPDRILSFRVCWEDDQGNIRTNRGYRVQFNNAIGPYKGGLRFHKSVSLSILKFLGFEQVFKNSLTSLSMGGAKGGSDFNPKGKSEREIMRFCQAFMTQLWRHIGADCDVPAGDIGVGAREISYLFGQHKRLTNEFTGVLTGKGLSFGGSLVRTEATGYGCVYLTQEMLNHAGRSIEGQRVAISGSGNVAQYAAQKATELGAKVVTLSDSNGTIHLPDGLSAEQLEWIIDLKTNRRGRLSEFSESFKADYVEGKRPWHLPCDIALPCATQNEISKTDAEMLAKNGCFAVAEGANMPTEADAVRVLQQRQVSFLPGKAANAGGVAVSGLEMSQNSVRLSWSRDEVDSRLREIMKRIHTQCLEYGTEQSGRVDYVKGANIAGFIKVADAMVAYGVL